jgi:hypothetical protein
MGAADAQRIEKTGGRDFAPCAPFGMCDDACDRLRRRYGLPPLEL